MQPEDAIGGLFGRDALYRRYGIIDKAILSFAEIENMKR